MSKEISLNEQVEIAFAKMQVPKAQKERIVALLKNNNLAKVRFEENHLQTGTATERWDDAFHNIASGAPSELRELLLGYHVVDIKRYKPSKRKRAPSKQREFVVLQVTGNISGAVRENIMALLDENKAAQNWIMANTELLRELIQEGESKFNQIEKDIEDANVGSFLDALQGLLQKVDRQQEWYKKKEFVAKQLARILFVGAVGEAIIDAQLDLLGLLMLLAVLDYVLFTGEKE